MIRLLLATMLLWPSLPVGGGNDGSGGGGGGGGGGGFTRHADWTFTDFEGTGCPDDELNSGCGTDPDYTTVNVGETGSESMQVAAGETSQFRSALTSTETTGTLTMRFRIRFVTLSDSGFFLESKNGTSDSGYDIRIDGANNELDIRTEDSICDDVGDTAGDPITGLVAGTDYYGEVVYDIDSDAVTINVSTSSYGGTDVDTATCDGGGTSIAIDGWDINLAASASNEFVIDDIDVGS